MSTNGADDVRKYAAERGLEEKAAEFVEKGGEVYAKT